MVAGRSVSSDRLANSALRVRILNGGQAAEAASALSESQETTSSQIQIAGLRELLLQLHLLAIGARYCGCCLYFAGVELGDKEWSESFHWLFDCCYFKQHMDISFQFLDCVGLD